MKIRFNHPETDIPCIGWWEDKSTFFFDIDSSEDFKGKFSEEKIDVTYKWCMRNAFNCDSVDKANSEFSFLGIKVSTYK